MIEAATTGCQDKMVPGTERGVMEGKKERRPEGKPTFSPTSQMAAPSGSAASGLCRCAKSIAEVASAAASALLSIRVSGTIRLPRSRSLTTGKSCSHPRKSRNCPKWARDR